MKYLYIATLSAMLMAFGQNYAPQPMQQGYAPQPQQKPLIAVPLFVNKTAGHVSRVAPGVYKDRVKQEAAHRLDVDAEAPNSRYIESKNIEFSAGEWQLPEVAAEVATDATTSALSAAGRWRILTRSTPALKSVDSEMFFQGTGAQTEATQAFSALQQADANYLLLGRINRFRVDETKGEAYGVRRWQVVTSVSMDLQLLDVHTHEIIAGRQMSERIVMRVPEGVSSISGIYDWEAALRSAVSKAIPEFIASIQTGPTGDTIHASAPMVTFKVSSTPESASVLFNGNFVGTTPCQVTAPAVAGVLMITQQGYEPWQVSLVPNASMKINPVLRELPPPTPLPVPAQQQPAAPAPQGVAPQGA